MKVKSQADVKSFMKGLEVKVKNISEEAFKQKVNSIYDKLVKAGGALDKAKASIRKYLVYNKQRIDPTYRVTIPNVISKNLSKTIGNNGIVGLPKYSRVSSNLTATITTWVGIDKDKNGSNTVLNKRNQPYAEYLNTSKKFARFNNFFAAVRKHYDSNFELEVSKVIKEELGTNVTSIFRY